MAAEGKNKVASSLLDLQPTAVLELFKVFPDRINKPTEYLGFHGGSIFDKPITWQGIKYLCLAVESEGFDILGDGKLSRPKIRVANHNNIVTNLLQINQDFINAKVIRKRVSVKFLDDANFDGGNPFGVADPTAELAEETWIMGRKVQESKIFVEFELNSPLDLENFSVNARGVVAKFCYWQYRGEGCRYEGIPIEKDDGSPFLDADGSGVKPNLPSSYSLPDSPVDFFTDPAAEWSSQTAYLKGDVVIVSSPSILLPPTRLDDPPQGVPLKTAYVCVTGTEANPTSGEKPEGNPTFWQKDGCTKKFTACQKRFNPFDKVAFYEGQNISTGFSGVKISGANGVGDEWWLPTNTGLFHSNELTGYLTGAFTLVGWANTNANTAYGAGIFSTSQRSDRVWPDCRFINIGAAIEENPESFDYSPNAPKEPPQIRAYHMGYLMSPTSYKRSNNSYRVRFLNNMQSAGDQREWTQYVTRHSTGTANFINGEGAEEDTIIEFFVDGQGRETITHDMQRNQNTEAANVGAGLGNFASIAERTSPDFDRDDSAAVVVNNGLPQCFILGAAEHYYGEKGYTNGSKGIPAYTASINGALGPWALWNRALTDEELDYLYKPVRFPLQMESKFDFVPRPYGECTGGFSTLTGGTGDGSPEGTAPLLFGLDSLVSWWDGSTGDTSIGNGLLDIHTGGNHLTGSGDFSGFNETYSEGPTVLLDNPTTVFPRFGGYPGTDGFSYGRNTTL